ncbi:hypothetical protein GCWU000324_02373 [Kingella oralis ATCC 51147]|uniref:Uncharacterized protein n=1 Tax=Kingella oralis ATCC 51147 TaxID=629741 RepID=C4GJZ9_9NEIS|nr:hypothetical protein GCWU000324_02373 [Kingella oralis ATCC 51147]
MSACPVAPVAPSISACIVHPILFTEIVFRFLGCLNAHHRQPENP